MTENGYGWWRGAAEDLLKPLVALMTPGATKIDGTLTVGLPETPLPFVTVI